MKQTNKKWVNPKLKSRLLNKKKFTRLMHKNKVTAIYDLRSIDNEVKKSIKMYQTIDPVLIENYLSLHDKKEIIILISEYERTYVSLLTKKRLEGYKKIFIYKADKDNLDWIIKK